jgi:hypothetical protein
MIGKSVPQETPPYNIPPEISTALLTDRPELIQIYIGRSKSGQATEMARLIADLIKDRINDRQRIGALEAMVAVLKENAHKAIKVLEGEEFPGEKFEEG